MNANQPDNVQGGPQPPGPLPEAGQYVQVQLPQRRPYVTYAILGVTILVFILQQASLSFLGRDWLAIWGDKNNLAIQVYHQYWRFFTPMLLHANILHIGFNMYALYIFGPGLERFYGHWRFLGLYLLGGFTGNVLSFVFTNGLSLGASTAIFGLVAAEGIFIFRNRYLYGNNVRAMLTNIVIIVVFNLALGLSPGIDNFGHLGGLMGGAAFAWWAGPLFKVTGMPPALRLADSRPEWMQWLTWLVVFAAFVVLTVFVILSR